MKAEDGEREECESRLRGGGINEIEKYTRVEKGGVGRVSEEELKAELDREEGPRGS